MAPVGRFGARVELAADAVVLTAGAGDDLPDAVRVRGAARVELGEALVVVLVSVEHHVRVGCVQVVPERPDRSVGGGARRIEGMMEVRQRASVRMRGEVVREPDLLRAPGFAGHVAAIGVERDQVPWADVVAVVALRRITGGGTEIPEVAARAHPAVGPARRVVFVIADGRVGDRLHGIDTPRGIVGLLERGSPSAFVLFVPEGEDRGEGSSDQLGAGIHLMAAGGRPDASVEPRVDRIARDVAGGRDHWVAGRRRRLERDETDDDGGHRDGSHREERPTKRHVDPLYREPLPRAITSPLSSWWTQGDSNPRPHGCQPCALPAELWARSGEVYPADAASDPSSQLTRGASRQSRSRS